MRSAIIANGSIASIEALLPLILSHQRIVAVDAGLVYCNQAKIIPNLLVGDFDSCPPSLLDAYGHIPQIRLPVDKDETDLEAAIREERKQNPERITLFGAWGGRIDHSLACALILGRYPMQVRLQTEKEEIFAIQKTVTLSCRIGQTVSLIPLYGPAKGITTSGLKWELNRDQLDQNRIGISNVCLEREIKITVLEGALLCCLLHL